MDQPFLDRLARQTDELRASGPLQARARPRFAAAAAGAPRRRPRAHQPLREQLPRPRQPPGDPRGRAPRRSTATATAWPRSASSAARRPCTRSSRRGSPRFLGTDDTILYSSCFDANGGLFETLLDEQDAVISDALEPREHHRRHPALQGAAAALRQQRPRRARDAAQGGRRRPREADRHRRRVLHGRHDRPPAARSATSPTATARS